VKYAVTFPYKVAADYKLPFPYNTKDFPPPDKPQYTIVPEGSQFADSSRSMTAYYQVMRLYGAGIRLGMLRAAAAKWGVDKARVMEECYAEKHRVFHRPSGRSIDYRWLLRGASKEHP